MSNYENAINLLQARSDMYRFLGGLYIMEVDKDQLALLKNMTFPEIEDSMDSADLDLKEGYALLKGYLSNASEDGLDDLAADYAKVFLAAGDATGKAAFPYEAVYTDPKRQFGGSTELQMKAKYKAKGLEASKEMYRTMDDNIGLILEFFANLCDETKAALAADNIEKAKELMAEQKNLLGEHLTNWAFSFCSDVVKYSERDFYKGLAKITAGFLRQESNLLSGEGVIWE